MATRITALVFLTALTQGAVCWAVLKVLAMVVLMGGGRRGVAGAVKVTSRGVARVRPIAGLMGGGVGAAARCSADLCAGGLAGLGSRRSSLRLVVIMALIVGVQGVACDECDSIGVGETVDMAARLQGGVAATLAGGDRVGWAKI